jgi:hypothetical protein
MHRNDVWPNPLVARFEEVDLVVCRDFLVRGDIRESPSLVDEQSSRLAVETTAVHGARRIARDPCPASEAIR